MLTPEQIEFNKNRFLELVDKIERDFDKEMLLKQLNGSDFFVAPASSMCHNAFEGGLCHHCLNVYDTLTKMCRAFYTKYDENGECMGYDCPYSDETLIIVSLFHDFDKMNKYEKTVRNQKVYSPTGSKYDEMGKFDWVSVAGYKKKDKAEVFTIGTHGENSVYMTDKFIPISIEEIFAILNHHSVYDNPMLDNSTIFSKYHLSCLLHTADTISAFVVETRE